MTIDQINELVESYENYNIDFNDAADFDRSVETLKEEAADFIAKYCILNKLDINDIDNHDDLVDVLVSYTLSDNTKALHTCIKSEVRCTDIDIDEVLYNIDSGSCEYMIRDELRNVVCSEIDSKLIYWDDAIAYLKENDPSLSESLELASDSNYSLEKIDSCLLARMHYFEYLINANEDIAEEIYNIIEEYTTTYDHDTLLDEYLENNCE